MTFVWIWLTGSLTAIFLHVVMAAIIRAKLAPAWSYLASMNEQLEKYNLYFDIEKQQLRSLDSGYICPTYSGLKLPRYLDIGVIVQSMLLSWLNAIIVGIGLMGVLSQSATMTEYLSEMKSEFAKIEDPIELSNQLKMIATSALEANSYDMSRKVQVELFIDEHIGG